MAGRYGPNKIRITLEQIRIANKAGSRYENPCYEHIEKITNAMEAADFNIRPLYKYVQAADDCYAKADYDEKRKAKASTSYYLSKYVDLQKNKRK